MSAILRAISVSVTPSDFKEDAYSSRMPSLVMDGFWVRTFTVNTFRKSGKKSNSGFCPNACEQKKTAAKPTHAMPTECPLFISDDFPRRSLFQHLGLIPLRNSVARRNPTAQPCPTCGV